MTLGPQQPHNHRQDRPDQPDRPDWAALAERSEARARRRKRRMRTGGAALAGLATAAVVATAVAGSSHHAEPVATATATATVLLPPRTSALDILSSAEKDTAPLSTATLFPGRKLLTAGRTFARTATARTGNCSSAAASSLSTALARNGCRQLFRATFTEGTVAVTVGIAVFDNAAQAGKARDTTQYLRPLADGGATDFCRNVACRLTSSSIGRYAYYTIGGLRNGRTITPDDTRADTAARTAAKAVSDFAFAQISRRGLDQAGAAARP
ncbi:hypothetical protein OG607_17720 [Streptomyces sp. NBC_01537]|uniref:hypothetical protein n=1 Tax=Streptomyces sp. NBC_01537 TaxID=2903896 RepID=UPI00386864FC